MSEIRIRIETGNRDVSQTNRAQELVVRAMFQRYFAKDSYRGAVVTVFVQMFAVFLGLYAGLATTGIIITIIGLGLTRALLKGLGVWLSTPPPEPPSPDDLAAPR